MGAMTGGARARSFGGAWHSHGQSAHRKVALKSEAPCSTSGTDAGTCTETETGAGNEMMLLMADSTDDAGTLDWRIYADATCAGLSVLIPLPLVDILFETIFRRRVPATIAKTRGRPISPVVRRQLSRSVDGPLSLSGCLVVAVAVGKYILRKLWRKIIYIFAVKDATTALTEYWHHAYLTDHMIRAGHLEPGTDTDLALRVSGDVLRDIDPSPLMGLARQTVANAHHVLSLMVRARRLGAAEVTRSLGEMISSHWRMAEGSLEDTARRYDERYRAEIAARRTGGPPPVQESFDRFPARDIEA